MKTSNGKASQAVPASHGISWLIQSLSLIRLQAGRLLLIAMLMQVILGLTQVPLIGLLVVISVPGFSAGILEAFHVTARNGRPGPGLLLKPLTSGTHSGRLLAMGALVFAIGILSVSLILTSSAELLDPDLISRIEQGDVDAIAQLNPDSLQRMVLAFMLGVAISGTLSFFTIPLMWFRDRRLWPALAAGLKALVTHWKAFLVLGLGVAAVLLPVMVAAGILIWLASSAGGVVSMLLMGLIMILILAFQLLLFGTQYCSFLDVFGIEDEKSPPAPEDESQLVA